MGKHFSNVQISEFSAQFKTKQNMYMYTGQKVGMETSQKPQEKKLKSRGELTGQQMLLT